MKTIDKNDGESFLLESNLYAQVESFFATEKKCEKTGSAVSSSLMLRLFGGSIYPDVYGIVNSRESNFQIYMAEGKRSFFGRNFDICKGQAVSLQRFANFVYVFFPSASWNELSQEEKQEIEKECNALRLGLLLVSEDSCQEKLPPSTSEGLLTNENRELARSKIIQYFPDFLGPDENAQFFKENVQLADSIIKESCILMEDLGGVFRGGTQVGKQAIKPWYREDQFELYYSSWLKNSKIYLLMEPFGDRDFKTYVPTLIVEEKFEKSLLRKDDLRRKLMKHISESFSRKCLVTTEEYVFDATVKREEMLDNIERSISKTFSIFETIAILGVEKGQIKEEVEESLQRAMTFSKALG